MIELAESDDDFPIPLRDSDPNQSMGSDHEGAPFRTNSNRISQRPRKKWAPNRISVLEKEKEQNLHQSFLDQCKTPEGKEKS